MQRKGLLSYMHELELKYILIGVAIGLALGYLQWHEGMDLVGTVMNMLPI